MKDRRELQDELNRINELYQQYDLELRKSGGSDAQRQQMRDTLNAKKAKLTAEMGDDLQNLNLGKNVKVSGGTLSGTEMDQSNLPDMAKQKGLGKEGMFKKLGKGKGGLIAGVLGAGASALLPENSYAADIAERIGRASEETDPMAQAQKFSERLASPEDIMQRAAEIKARKAYDNSPAAAGAKEAALKKLRGY